VLQPGGLCRGLRVRLWWWWSCCGGWWARAAGGVRAIARGSGGLWIRRCMICMVPVRSSA
jgi:hypothetical protein